MIERAASNEPDVCSAVLTEDRHLASRAAVDTLPASLIAGDVDRLRLFCEQLYTARLDQQIDDECASGLALTVEAVTAVDEEWVGVEAVAHSPAGASTVPWLVHQMTVPR